MLFVICMCFLSCCFFFFKQKTAYEMRISDWSSDVCSSDLRLNRIEARVVTEDLHLVAVAQAMVAQEPQLAGHLVVVGDDDAGIAPDVDDLERVHRKPEIGRASCRERVCQYV